MKRRERPFQNDSGRESLPRTNIESLKDYPFNIFLSSVHKLIVRERTQVDNTQPKVLICDYVDPKKRGPRNENRPAPIHLKGDWRHTKLEIGDVINLIEEKRKPDDQDFYEVTDKQNFVVLNPDIVVTASQFSNVSCPRRPFFSTKFKDIRSQGLKQLIGSLTHDIFQTMLERNDFRFSTFRVLANEALEDKIIDLFYLNISFSQMLKELRKFPLQFDKWKRKFCAPNSSEVIPHIDGAQQSRKCRMGQLVDIEEPLFSPKWGLCGNADVTTTVYINKNIVNNNRGGQRRKPNNLGRSSNSAQPQQQKKKDDEKEVLCAWELKSCEAGNKMRKYHHDQLIVYLILLREKYKLYDLTFDDFSHGVLYYFGDNTMLGEHLSRNIIRSVTQKRNGLVRSLFSRGAFKLLEDEQEPLRRRDENAFADNFDKKKDDLQYSDPFEGTVDDDDVDDDDDDVEEEGDPNNNSRPPSGFPSQASSSQASQRRATITSTQKLVEDVVHSQGTFDEYDEVIISLPQPKKIKNMTLNPNSCEFCFQARECTIHHAIYENGECFNERYHQSSAIKPNYDKYVKASDSRPLRSFVRKWNSLVDLEDLENEYFRNSSRNPDVSFNNHYWTHTGPEREKLRRCFSCMVIEGHIKVEDGKHFYKFRKHENDAYKTRTFVTSKKKKKSKRVKKDLRRISDLKKGEYVAISTETGIIKVGSGCIIRITSETVMIEVRKEIRLPYKDKTKPPYPPLFRIDIASFGSSHGKMRSNLFRLFKKECTKLRNMVLLHHPPRFDENQFFPNTLKKQQKQKKKRKQQQSNSLIQEDEDDEEEEVDEEQEQPLVRHLRTFSWYERLNPDQKLAIHRIMSTKDYLLLHGFPGTGKTTTICHAIEVLVRLRKKVLVVAYTHTAVDHILSILVRKGLGEFIYRIGRSEKVDDNLKEYTQEKFLERIKNQVEERRRRNNNNNNNNNMGSGGFNVNSDQEEVLQLFKEKIKEKLVFGCTCMGVPGDTLLSALKNQAQKEDLDIQMFLEDEKEEEEESEGETDLDDIGGGYFDYCVMDEATQITLPLSLSPLSYAHRSVLIGDPYQLSPLVRGKKAGLLGMSSCLFSYLVNQVKERKGTGRDGPLMTQHSQRYHHGSNRNSWGLAYVQLTYQYRMNEGIMTIPNEIVYGGNLKCANDNIRNSVLSFPGLPQFMTYISTRGENKVWVKDVLSSFLSTTTTTTNARNPSPPVIFIDTDRCSEEIRKEKLKGEEIFNPFECGIIAQICMIALQFMGAKCSQIGVMTPYNLQVKKIRGQIRPTMESILRRRKRKKEKKKKKESSHVPSGQHQQQVEMDPEINRKSDDESKQKEEELENLIDVFTIDKFQGLDRDLVILSLVRSNRGEEISRIMTSLQRINVAFTRAKKKFIIVGSLSTHRRRKPFSLFLEMIIQKNWVYEIDEEKIRDCRDWIKKHQKWSPNIEEKRVESRQISKVPPPPPQKVSTQQKKKKKSDERSNENNVKLVRIPPPPLPVQHPQNTQKQPKIKVMDEKVSIHPQTILHQVNQVQQQVNLPNNNQSRNDVRTKRDVENRKNVKSSSSSSASNIPPPPPPPSNQRNQRNQQKTNQTRPKKSGNITRRKHQPEVTEIIPPPPLPPPRNTTNQKPSKEKKKKTKQRLDQVNRTQQRPTRVIPPPPPPPQQQQQEQKTTKKKKKKKKKKVVPTPMRWTNNPFLMMKLEEEKRKEKEEVMILANSFLGIYGSGGEGQSQNVQNRSRKYKE